ncbi:MAG: DUF2029 domain-containing protein [Xanthobacteraceae bacterium]|nr:DUF2029 domain-containing protein [Xanthobacteraceae bacterium]QYK44770.1 MAG: DUF2029 domain-containing protein [Xanthobacteraceae bacterium]
MNPADSATSPPGQIPKALELFCFAFCVGNAVWLGTAAMSGSWLWDPAGRLLSTDFLNVYAAGKLTLAGQAAAAYDWPTHKQMEIAVLGYDFGGYYGWHYPPFYLFIALTLASLPYVPATLLWVAVSLVPYLAAMRAIVGSAAGFLLAFAMPSFLANVLVGQNGFLTAALIGGALYFLERRAVLAGICLGLLTYKPHFGILFPVALIAGGYWRAIFSAFATALMLVLLSLLAFGPEPWLAFVKWLPVTSQTFLSEGRAEIEKMQSVFAIVRTLGGAEWLAWGLHAVFAAGVAVAIAAIWRDARHPFALKAAALATGVVLATPYIYLYDTVVLAIPAAFLLRLGLAEGFRRHELAGLGTAALLLASFPFVKLPVGFAAAVIVAVLVARRLFEAPRRAAT